MTLISCPGCGEVAEVIDRFVIPSTNGPVEHVRTQCVRRHFYMAPLADVQNMD